MGYDWYNGNIVVLTLLQVRDLKEFGLAVHKHRERDEVEDDNGECQTEYESVLQRTSRI